ncbi:MAG: hypothetical protein RIS97_1080, partial [Pseudomonadota bacterium]
MTNFTKFGYIATFAASLLAGCATNQ